MIALAMCGKSDERIRNRAQVSASFFGCLWLQVCCPGSGCRKHISSHTKRIRFVEIVKNWIGGIVLNGKSPDNDAPSLYVRPKDIHTYLLFHYTAATQAMARTLFCFLYQGIMLYVHSALWIQSVSTNRQVTAQESCHKLALL